MTRWKPINTAPRDGTRILLYFPDYPDAQYGYWHQWASKTAKTNGWRDGAGGSYGFRFYEEPTHWMALPKVPIK